MSSIKKDDNFYIWTTLAVVALGTFMSALDSSIVNIALPKIMAVFQESVDNSRWIITCYTLALGAVIPISGYLMDKFGAKRIYILSLAFFTFGSLLCGLAWNNSSMIVFRIIQGLGGGMIMPVGMSIIFQTFPENKRGTAMGIWGIAAMAAPTIGPTLSGYIVEYLDWRLIFTINIPIGIFTIFMAIFLLKEFPKKEVKQFDIIGFISASTGIVFCLYILGKGSSIDWNDIKNVLFLIIGIFSLIIFVVNELTHPAPMLDLKILKILSFSFSIIIISILTMGMFGVVFLIPLYLQNLRGYTPMQAGMIMLPSALVMSIFMAVSGILSNKLGSRTLIISGTIFLVITSYGLSKITIDTPLNIIILFMMLISVALGLTLMPTMNAGMAWVPHPLISRASALTNTIRQIASSLSVTILTTIMMNTQNAKYALYATDSNIFNQATVNLLNLGQSVFMQNGLTQSNASAVSLSLLSGIIQRQAFLDSINAALIASTIFTIITIPLAFMIKNKKFKKDDRINISLIE